MVSFPQTWKIYHWATDRKMRAEDENAVPVRKLEIS